MAKEITGHSTMDTILMSKLITEANKEFSSKNWPAFNNTTKRLITLAKSSNDTVNLSKGYRYRAEYYREQNVNDSAFYFYLKSERLYAKLNDKINLGKTIYRRGIIQFLGGDYLGADLSVSQAYTLLKNHPDKQLLYQIVSTIGVIANQLEDYSRAIDYHNRALQLIKEFHLNNNLNQRATTLNNLANVYERLNKNRNAIILFTEALTDSINLKSMPDLYARLLDNYAYSKLKVRDYNELPKIFFKALKIRDSINQDSGIIGSKIHLSEYYISIGDTINSLKYANEAHALAKKIESPLDLLVSLKQLALIDKENASQYSKKYIEINDSLQQVERRSRDKFTRLQLETDDIIVEKDKLEEQNKNLIYFFSAILLFGLLLFIIRNQRMKNKELMFIQSQQKANEEIYGLMISQQQLIEEHRVKEKHRIAQELHDGILGRLFGARLNLDSLNKFSAQSAISKRFEYLDELKRIEQDIREISHDLSREKAMVVNNFTAIVTNLIKEQESSYAPKVMFSNDEKIKWEEIENTRKIHLYRILQEGLQNINKYADATIISISLSLELNTIILVLKDNGNGFDVATAKRGIGLQNIMSRVNECQGTLQIKSKKGHGTLIKIAIPKM